MDAVVLTIPLQWERELVLRWTRDAAEAARAAGVRLMVLNASARLPAARTDVANFELRRECELVVRRCGPPLIVLRPPLFMENLAAPWISGVVARDRVLPYPLAAEIAVAWLSVADLGAYVGAALRRPDLVGQTLDVGGPEALDGHALARALSPSEGPPVAYYAVPPPVVEQQLGAMLGPTVARGIAATYAWIDEHRDAMPYAGTSGELERALGRKPTTVRDWALAAGLVPNASTAVARI
jgi:uncharacterized protein YbjT (DUF2867 family)